MIRQDDTADLTRAALRRAVILTTAYYHGLRIHRAPIPHNDIPSGRLHGTAPVANPAPATGATIMSNTPVHGLHNAR